MVSTDTQEEDRLLLELDHLKVDINAMLDDKFCNQRKIRPGEGECFTTFHF